MTDAKPGRAFNRVLMVIFSAIYVLIVYQCVSGPSDPVPKFAKGDRSNASRQAVYP